MEFHPKTLNFLCDFKNSKQKTLPINIIALLIDTKAFIDYDFIYSIAFSHRRSRTTKIQMVQAIYKCIEQYFEYAIYTVQGKRLYRTETTKPFSNIVMHKKSFGMYLLKDAFLNNEVFEDESIIKTILATRNRIKKRKQEGIITFLSTSQIHTDLSSKKFELNKNEIQKDKIQFSLASEQIINENQAKKSDINTVPRSSQLRINIAVKKTAGTLPIDSEPERKQDEIPMQPVIREERMKQLIQKRKSALYNFIRRDLVENNQPHKKERFSGIVFPQNSVVFELGQPVRSLRTFKKNQKLTYIRFHDTIRPALHEHQEKFRSRISIKKIPCVLNYDEDSDLFWNDEEDGESINYATDTEDEPYEESFDCSWIEDEPEQVVKKKNSKFKFIIPNIPINFVKDFKKYKFFD